MTEYYHVIQYFITLAGVTIIFNSLIMLIVLISIRPKNRKKETLYLGLLQSVAELFIGLWLIFIQPVFIDLDFSFVIGLLVAISVVICLFLRLYFFSNLRSMYSK